LKAPDQVLFVDTLLNQAKLSLVVAVVYAHLVAQPDVAMIWEP